MGISLSSSTKGAMQSNGSAKINFTAGANGSTSTTFSPPANCVIDVMCTGGNTTLGTEVPSNSGTALTWVNKGKVANGGQVAWVFQAFNANAQSNITLNFPAGLSDGNTDPLNNGEGEYWIRCWTGCNSNQTGAAVTTGNASASSGNISLVSTVAGSQCEAIMVDFSATWSSTDLFDTAAGGGFAQMLPYKAANNGAPGTVNLNFSGDTSVAAAWVMVELLPAPTGVAPILMGQACL